METTSFMKKYYEIKVLNVNGKVMFTVEVSDKKQAMKELSKYLKKGRPRLQITCIEIDEDTYNEMFGS